MRPNFLRRAQVLLAALLLSGCARSMTLAAPTPAAAVPPSATLPPLRTPDATLDAATCDLTPSLQVHTWLGNHKVNDVGTKECDYLVLMQNANRTESVVPVVFQQSMDAFNGTEESGWQALPTIPPGGRAEWQGFVYLVNDRRATMPMARIPKALVALKASEACRPLQSNPAFLQARAQVVKEPCSPDILLWPGFLRATIPGPDD